MLILLVSKITIRNKSGEFFQTRLNYGTFGIVSYPNNHFPIANVSEFVDRLTMTASSITRFAIAGCHILFVLIHN